MNTTLFIVVVIVIAGLVLTSLVVEAMRAEPDKPAVLSWAPDLPGRLPCYTWSGKYRDCEDVKIARQ